MMICKLHDDVGYYTENNVWCKNWRSGKELHFESVDLETITPHKEEQTIP